MHLTPTAPYDLHLSARLMARYHGVLDLYHPAGYYLRALASDGVPALFRADQPAPDAPLTLTFLAGNPTPATQQTAARILATHDDFTAFYALARTDDRLWRIVRPLYGLHHLQSETVFEALVLVIIEQQISLTAALRAQRALVSWGGRGVAYQTDHYPIFPSPAQIATTDPATLHTQLKITRRRVAVIHAVAQAIIGGQLDLEGLRKAPVADAYARLMAIKGVGHWTAAWTLIRGMGHYPYAAHNDVALRDAVAHYFYDTDQRVSAATVANVFSAYGPHAGLAAFYTLMRWAVERY
jgi:3-methyladenine DNA glycosylase/8-oxoguanine DNA glycosylase